MHARICIRLGGDPVGLGALTQSLPSSIGVIMYMAVFALSDADASLRQPALPGEPLCLGVRLTPIRLAISVHVF